MAPLLRVWWCMRVLESYTANQPGGPWRYRLPPTAMRTTIAIALFVATVVASNGDPGNSEGKGKGKNKPTIAERPTVIPRDLADDSSSSDKGKGKPETPGRPDNPALPTEVKSLVTTFQSARETYLNQQKDLQRRLKNASEEEREAIREQIRESLERWKEQHKQFVKDVKERAHEMKEQLQPDLGRLIDQGSKDGNDRGR